MDDSGKDLIDISKNRMDITSFKKDCLESWDYILFGYALLTLTVNLVKLDKNQGIIYLSR